MALISLQDCAWIEWLFCLKIWLQTVVAHGSRTRHSLAFSGAQQQGQRAGAHTSLPFYLLKESLCLVGRCIVCVKVGPPPDGPALVLMHIPVVFFTASGIPGEVDERLDTAEGIMAAGLRSIGVTSSQVCAALARCELCPRGVGIQKGRAFGQGCCKVSARGALAQGSNVLAQPTAGSGVSWGKGRPHEPQQPGQQQIM
eukprot:217021-Pelagomonas_calceolata.AAC.1